MLATLFRIPGGGRLVLALALVVLLVCLMFSASAPISQWAWDSVSGNDFLAFALIFATIVYLMLRRD